MHAHAHTHVHAYTHACTHTHSELTWDKLTRKEVNSPFRPVVRSRYDISNFDESSHQRSLSSHLPRTHGRCELRSRLAGSRQRDMTVY